MSQEFQPGDFLIFSTRIRFRLLRFLANTERDGEKIWHLAAYNDLFLDADSVDRGLANPEKLPLANRILP